MRVEDLGFRHWRQGLSFIRDGGFRVHIMCRSIQHNALQDQVSETLMEDLAREIIEITIIAIIVILRVVFIFISFNTQQWSLPGELS